MHSKSRIPSPRALLAAPLLAATLFVGVSSAALALSTAYGEDDQNFKEQAVEVQQKLEQAGYSQITDMRIEKHGFTAHAVKDGKPVKVEFNERFGIEQE